MKTPILKVVVIFACVALLSGLNGAGCLAGTDLDPKLKGALHVGKVYYMNKICDGLFKIEYDRQSGKEVPTDGVLEVLEGYRGLLELDKLEQQASAPSTPTPSTAPNAPPAAPSTPAAAPSTPAAAPSTPAAAPSTPTTAPSTPATAPSTPATASSTPPTAPGTSTPVIDNVTGYAWDEDTGRLVVVRGDGNVSNVIDVGPKGVMINWANGAEYPPEYWPPEKLVPRHSSGHGRTGVSSSPSTQGQVANNPSTNTPSG